MIAQRASFVLGFTILATLVSGAPVGHGRAGPRSGGRCKATATKASSTVFEDITETTSLNLHPSSTASFVASSSAFSSTATSSSSSSHTASSTHTVSSSATSNKSQTTSHSSTSTASPSSTSTASHSSTSTASHSSTHSPSPSATAPPTDRVVAAYYSDWASDIISPEQVDFNRLDWVDFAFAIPDENFNLQFTEDNSVDLLQRLVKQAHASGKGVKLSVGGWTGSAYFSSAVSTVANRETFAQNILNAYNQYNLDGIDLDWEYPNIAAASPNNGASPQDSANYLLFLQLLNSKLPSSAVVTAATQVWPWAGPDGQPLSDVSAFAPYLNWITLMNYDVSGSSSTPGANAPLSDGCNNSTQPMANAVAAVNSWTAAGFPASQIVLGVPSYGYVSQSTETQLYNRGNIARRSIQVESDSGSTSSGQIIFRDIISQGVLVEQNGNFVGAGGFKREWDSCSSTPWLRSASQSQVITYDDPASLEQKAAFALQVGLKGVNMFDASGDTEDWVLVDGLRSGLGLA